MEKSKKTWTLIVGLLFALIVVIELSAEYFANTKVVLVMKPLISISVIALYLVNSNTRSVILILSLILGLISSVLFIPNEPVALLWGVMVFAVHRLFLIFFLLKLMQKIDYFPILIASLPILIIFSYLVAINGDLNIPTMIVFSINNILISFFCGIIFANYLMNDQYTNTWLLISALMFIALQLIVYIEKFYLLEFSPRILRPIAVLFLAMALFTLVRGVLTQERLNRNASA